MFERKTQGALFVNTGEQKAFQCMTKLRNYKRID